ncbi:hypothetical protein ABZ946_30515 [Streptomyces sp. NPDC046324]|uniref:hypothetical protein n=1 Tax=Streptomyces sp. NPDC046324 TaxID=3154915 RepID=UPI0033C551D7
MTTDRSPLPEVLPGSTPDAQPEGVPTAQTAAEARAVPDEVVPAEARVVPDEGVPAPDPDPAAAVPPPASGRRSPAPYVRAVRLTPARAPEPGIQTPPRRRAVSVTPVRLPLPRPEPTAPPTDSRPEEPQP